MARRSDAPTWDHWLPVVGKRLQGIADFRRWNESYTRLCADPKARDILRRLELVRSRALVPHYRGRYPTREDRVHSAKRVPLTLVIGDLFGYVQVFL